MMQSKQSAFAIASLLLLVTGCTTDLSRSVPSQPASPQAAQPTPTQTASKPPGSAPASPSPRYHSQTLTSGEWTITVSYWSNAGNKDGLVYDGCDAQKKCVHLTNGKSVNRNGIIATDWQNGDYLYRLSFRNTIEKNSSDTRTLEVFKGDQIVLTVQGLTSSQTTDTIAPS